MRPSRRRNDDSASIPRRYAVRKDRGMAPVLPAIDHRQQSVYGDAVNLDGQRRAGLRFIEMDEAGPHAGAMQAVRLRGQKNVGKIIYLIFCAKSIIIPRWE